MKKNLFRLVCALVISFLHLSYGDVLFAQSFESSEDSLKFEEVRQRQAQHLLQDLDRLSKELERTSEEKKQQKLESNKNDLMFSLLETLTETNFRQKNDQPQSAKTTLSDDVKEIVSPFLDTIKTLSKRPRAIDELNEDISEHKNFLEKLEMSRQEVLNFFAHVKNKKLKNETLRFINEKEELAKRNLTQLQFELLKIENDNGGSFNAVSDYIFKFFKTKGLNLLIAAGVFLLVFWPLKLLKSPFLFVFMSQAQRRASSNSRVQWLKRPASVIYSFSIVVLAFLNSLLALYILNDWVLVTFILLSIFAVAWSSRGTFEKYAQDLKFILNFGAVREGERLIYQGIPWKLQGLGFYCRLVNPALSGGSLRVRADELMSLSARYCDDSEPWFPTKRDDWVELSDGTYGKVIYQSPEAVRVKLVGEQVKTIPTENFLQMNPVNLSQGFGIEVIFGVDYSHQALLLTDLLQKFKELISKRLDEDFHADKQSFHSVNVEFKSANASSLDLRVFILCEGKMASQKKFIGRKVNAYLVEACNRYDVVIPFNQLTLHHASNQKVMESANEQ